MRRGRGLMIGGSPIGLITLGMSQSIGSFSPLSLFAASEPGFWYDPSDLSTLFQDAAGTTPVTAAGQSVGLMLDKSQGLVLGAELVTNGGFSSADGWTLNANANISGGTLNVTSNIASGFVANRNASIALVVGRTYEFSFTVTAITGTISAHLGGSEGIVVTAPGTYRGYIVPVSGSNIGIVARSSGVSAATIDNISVRELPGNHATQSTSLSRPTYQVDSNGRGHLLFDGSDDFLVTPTITPGTDKAQVFAGVRKLSDATQAVVAGLSTNVGNPGVFMLLAPSANTTADYRWSSNGSAQSSAISGATYPAPTTDILTGIGGISTDTAILRVNGAQAATSPSDQGTGNFGNYPVYIGRRGGTALPFNGRIYSLICRFGPNLTADQIAQTEAWVNARTGAY